MNIVRCELEMPSQLSGLGFEPDDGIGIQVVTQTIVAVVVDPVYRWASKLNQLRIVCACHPAGAAAVSVSFPARFRNRVHRRWVRSSATLPCRFRYRMRRRIRRAFISTRSSRSRITHDQRRRCRLILRVRHFGSHQRARRTVEGNHVGIVGNQTLDCRIPRHLY